MKSKKFIFKGASILVLQEGEMVEFYMNYKTSDYFFCVGYKAKIEDITECDAISIWDQYFDSTVVDENALISFHEKMIEEMEERLGRKLKSPNSGGSEQG